MAWEIDDVMHLSRATLVYQRKLFRFMSICQN